MTLGTLPVEGDKIRILRELSRGFSQPSVAEGTVGTVLADTEEIIEFKYRKTEFAVRFPGIPEDDWWYADLEVEGVDWERANE